MSATNIETPLESAERGPKKPGAPQEQPLKKL